MSDLRSGVVTWAKWAVAHKSWFEYLESRPFPLYQPTAGHVIANDCSATATLMLWLAGAPEPFPGAYTAEQLDGELWGVGNTESYGQLEHVTDPFPGDFVVYGLGLPLGAQHMATVLESGSDPMTMSHGSPSEPRFVRAVEGCPFPAQGRITYVRCLPVTPTPVPTPPEDDMNLLIAVNPNNKGQVILNLQDGTYYGFDSPDMLAFYKDNGVQVAKRQPTKAEWAHFTQKGTI